MLYKKNLDKMEKRKITEKGTVTIPQKFRKKYGIRNGTKIFFQEEKDGIKIIPITPEMIKMNIGFIKGRRSLLKSLMEEKRKEREL